MPGKGANAAEAEVPRADARELVVVVAEGGERRERGSAEAGLQLSGVSRRVARLGHGGLQLPHLRRHVGGIDRFELREFPAETTVEATDPANANRFWYAAYDGRLWQDGNVGNTSGIGNGPGATAYNGKIYLMFNSPGGAFCYKTYDGSHWLSDTQIPNTPGCVGNPGAAVFDRKMYVLHQAPDRRFLYKTYDGDDWALDTAVPNTSGISAGPAAVVFSL